MRKIKLIGHGVYSRVHLRAEVNVGNEGRAIVQDRERHVVGVYLDADQAQMEFCTWKGSF